MALCSAITTPLTILSITAFLRDDLFKQDALEVKSKDLMSYNDVNFLKAYCWSQLHHVTVDGTVINLQHYSYFPYVLVLVAMLMYGVKILWRSRSVFQLSPNGNILYIYSYLLESNRGLFVLVLFLANYQSYM